MMSFPGQVFGLPCYQDSLILIRLKLFRTKKEPQTTTPKYKWAHCWDDVAYGATFFFAKINDKGNIKNRLKDTLIGGPPV